MYRAYRATRCRFEGPGVILRVRKEFVFDPSFLLETICHYIGLVIAHHTGFKLKNIMSP